MSSSEGIGHILFQQKECMVSSGNGSLGLAQHLLSGVNKGINERVFSPAEGERENEPRLSKRRQSDGWHRTVVCYELCFNGTSNKLAVGTALKTHWAGSQHPIRFQVPEEAVLLRPLKSLPSITPPSIPLPRQTSEVIPAMQQAIQSVEGFAARLATGELPRWAASFGTAWERPPGSWSWGEGGASEAARRGQSRRRTWAKLQVMDFVTALAHAEFGVRNQPEDEQAGRMPA